MTCESVTCTHFQSGLTALRMAQSEGGHQDVCDILLRHTQHDGSSIQQTERGSEGEGEMNRQQQETNAQLTEVRGMGSYMTTHWSL